MGDSKSDMGEEGLRRVAEKPAMVVPHSLFEYPLPIGETTDYITPSDRLFVLAHLGVPEIEKADWKLDIAGLVTTPLSLHYDQLGRYSKRTISTIHQCAGNPLKPTFPTRTIANVDWEGVLLRDILIDAGVQESCTHIWAFGLDFGSLTIGSFVSNTQEHYVKDLPIEYVMDADVIIATRLNGKSLSEKHGYPVRLVVPGHYGHNSVKWLCRLELANRRANGFFTTQLYNDPDSSTGGTKPTWEIEPESIIVSPTDGSKRVSPVVEISGWAWSFSEVTSVEVSTDCGATWIEAKVEPRKGMSWQRFRYQLRVNQAGPIQLMSRATDREGKSQPLDSARNSVHKVNISIE